MGIQNLDRMFNPKSIAVIGASERKGGVGSVVMANLVKGGWPGKVFPVNPRRKTVFGIPAFPSVSHIDSPLDLAVFVAPIATAPETVGECARKGVAGMVILSAGGRETGARGRALEDSIRKEAEHSRLRIIGPNCIGFVCSRTGLNASFAGQTPLAGKMAFVSQSGAVCTTVLDLSLKHNIGLSHLVSLGSMLDVDFGDMLDFLGGQPDVGSIMLYVESLSNVRKFMSAARSVSQVKPIVVLKAGRSVAGCRAAASHTGAMTGSDQVYDAAFERAGIVRVKTFDELFDCAELFARQPRPPKPGLVVVTNAGGPGVLAADALSDFGVEPAPLSPETLDKLNAILPPYWSRGNPVDILGDATPERYRQVVDILLEAPETAGMLVIHVPQAISDPVEVAEALISGMTSGARPVITSWMGGSNEEKGREIFHRAGVPTFDTPERAVRAFMNLYRYGRNIETLQEIPPRLPLEMAFDRTRARSLIKEAMERGRPMLTETESKSLLAAYGIPVNRMEKATSQEEAAQKARSMGFPVVLKVDSSDITHKTDAGGVILGLNDEASVGRAFERIMANAGAHEPQATLAGVTVQPMFTGSCHELILGAVRDRDFGPVILFGEGGGMTEIHRDTAFALPPMNRLLARRLMEKTRIWRVLQGYRAFPPADLALLEEILIRLAQIVIDFEEIEELEINPLLTTETGAYAVDARAKLSPSPLPAPLHLVISPYPSIQEKCISLEKNLNILVRPIQPEDGPLLQELFEALSPESIYYRFYNPLTALPHAMLARFTQIDYDREIALVAIREPGPAEKMLGVARVIKEPDGTEAEFSVIVGDPWHGKGIGAELLKSCLLIAKEQGVEKVWGLVLSDNTKMLALGKKLGFVPKRVPDGTEYELRINLRGLTPSLV